MTENNTQSAECLSRLTSELEALLLDDKLTQEQRARMKWDYIVEKNELLRLENVGLKLWIGTLLNSDGFDNGRYDAHDLRIARNQIKKMLDDPLSF